MESAGNAPALICLQGKCIACLPRPQKLARHPGAAPGRRSFGDSAAQAGARRVKIGAVAGSRAWTCSPARSHSAVKLQPRKLKGPGVIASRPEPFQQRTNTSCYLAIPTHGFTVVLSVFRGTPPAKPLNCKSVSNRLGARFRSVWTHHTGGTSFRSCA